MALSLNAHSPFEYFDANQLQQLNAAVEEILSVTGCIVHFEPAIEILKNAGARVDNGRVFLSKEMIAKAIATSPSSVTIYDRDGEPAMVLEGRNVYYGTGSDCNNILDTFTGEYRPFTEQDIIDAVRLCEALPNVDFVMSMGLLRSASPETQYQVQYADMLKYSKKPQVIIAANRQCLDDIVEIAAAVCGGREELKNKPRFVLYDEPTSPLVHSEEAMDKLIYAAENLVPTNYAPGMMAGATGPITPAGAVALAAAEAVLGLVLHQAVNPGAPYVFGAGMSNIDMHSMQPSYASPEAMMTQAGICQLGRELYNLPTWGFAGCCASKVADTQAINEASTYIWVAGLTGCNLNHDLGYLEFGLTYSFDLLVMCDESVSQIRRMMDGIVLSRETMAVDTIHSVGPGGSFLDSDHTLDHYMENWMPGISDRNAFDRWKELGATTMEERVKVKIKSILSVPAVPFDKSSDVDAVLAKIIDRG
jgi:trimethylamine--corrinoid protein Co-methyltransferase